MLLNKAFEYSRKGIWVQQTATRYLQSLPEQLDEMVSNIWMLFMDFKKLTTLRKTSRNYNFDKEPWFYQTIQYFLSLSTAHWCNTAILNPTWQFRICGGHLLLTSLFIARSVVAPMVLRESFLESQSVQKAASSTLLRIRRLPAPVSRSLRLDTAAGCWTSNICPFCRSGCSRPSKSLGRPCRGREQR